MKAKERSRITYANVVATLALFLALGGTSYAAITITGKNVKDNSLTTKDIKNRSLLGKDFKAGQLPAGPQGATGPQGPQGAKGDAGAVGVSGYQRVVSPSVANPAGGQNSGSVACPAGKKVLGGGVSSTSGDLGHNVNSSYPTSETTWRADVNNNSGQDRSFIVYAICAAVG